MEVPKSLQLNQTGLFTVLDVKGVKQPDATATTSGSEKRTENVRAVKSKGAEIKETGVRIGGDYTPLAKGQEPSFVAHRNAVFDRILAKRKEEDAAKSRKPIEITLPDGAKKEGTSWETTPLDIASGISNGLAQNCCVAKVTYVGGAVDVGPEVYGCSDDEDDDPSDAKSEEVLWDMTRPLVGDCKLEFCKFDSPEGKTTFWHSSAHILGQAMETKYGVKLTIGPPLENGFYYDCYMGDKTITESDFKDLEKYFAAAVKAKQPFERLVLSKEEALEMFSDNPFKVSIITNKVPDGSATSVYRNGPLIDLCLGPHMPNTGRMKAFAVQRNSSAYWLGDANNDSLQRVYGISFPDKKELKKYKQFLEEAAKRDHREIGTKQELFFFHPLSPGSAFWLPHGARVYNSLVQFIQKQLWQRHYTEVVTPNVFNFDLWHTSGHAMHYKDAMFCFDVEGQEFGMKPMNCPAHCLMFAHRLRSYRELPIRYADFGVLHRNELSGALTGLTRVRRFQQDDGHIFCREDQVEEEVRQALEFMKFVYGVFGMTYKLELSTMPKKALGEVKVWQRAEAALAAAMDTFGGKGSWRVNPGDGAFYGPKIDIKVYDAMERVHQCATIQLDFQLPIRFDLKYRSDGGEGGEGGAAFQRPIIVHRAMLGSVERMSAILIEHFAGKWPFWLSPRQAIIVPISGAQNDFAYQVRDRIHAAGFFVEVDDSSKTFKKKIAVAQTEQYNFILCVGAKEVEADSVNVRIRANTNTENTGVKTVNDCIAFFKTLAETYSREY